MATGYSSSRPYETILTSIHLEHGYSTNSTNLDALVCQSPMLEGWLRYVEPTTHASRWLWVDVVSVSYRLHVLQVEHR